MLSIFIVWKVICQKVDKIYKEKDKLKFDKKKERLASTKYLRKVIFSSFFIFTTTWKFNSNQFSIPKVT